MELVTVLHETTSKILPADTSYVLRDKPEPEIQLPRILFKSINFFVKILLLSFTFEGSLDSYIHQLQVRS